MAYGKRRRGAIFRGGVVFPAMGAKTKDPAEIDPPLQREKPFPLDCKGSVALFAIAFSCHWIFIFSTRLQSGGGTRVVGKSQIGDCGPLESCLWSDTVICSTRIGASLLFLRTCLLCLAQEQKVGDAAAAVRRGTPQ